jgi:N-acyl-D-aspartate/D-glutamate deacylase
MPAEGVHYTIVNGAVLYEAGRYSGKLPGKVLRADNPSINAR